MKCGDCGLPMITFEFLDDRIIHRCELGCHFIINFHNGNYLEEFNIYLQHTTSKNQWDCVRLTASNFVEKTLNRRMPVYKRTCTVYDPDGYGMNSPLLVLDNYTMPMGATSIPGFQFLKPEVK